MLKKILIVLIILVLLLGGAYIYLSLQPVEEIVQQEVVDPRSFPTSEERGFESTGETVNFPGSSTNPPPINNTGGTGFGNEITDQDKRFKRIYSLPVAGAKVYGTDQNLDLRVRFVDRATGHISEYLPKENKTIEITKTDVPRIQTALWGKNDTNVALQYLDEEGTLLKTFLGTIVEKESNENNKEFFLGGSFLPDNILSIATAPNDVRFSDIIYTLENSGGGSDTYINTFTGKNTEKLFSSPITEWLLDWPNRFAITLNTKPSFDTKGYVYKIHSDSRASDERNFTKVLGNRDGLVGILNSDSTKILYSTTEQDEINTHILNLETGDKFNIGQPTLADKCVWSQSDVDIAYCAVPTFINNRNNPLDNWYAGLVTFSDAIHQINTETGDVSVLFLPSFDAGENIDIVDLSVSPDDSYLIFRSRTDGSLWGYNIEKEN